MEEVEWVKWMVGMMGTVGEPLSVELIGVGWLVSERRRKEEDDLYSNFGKSRSSRDIDSVTMEIIIHVILNFEEVR